MFFWPVDLPGNFCFFLFINCFFFYFVGFLVLPWRFVSLKNGVKCDVNLE